MRIFIKALMILAWVVCIPPTILAFTSSFNDPSFSRSASSFATIVFIAAAALTILYFWIAKGQKKNFEEEVSKVGAIKYLEHKRGTGIAITQNGMIAVSKGKKVKFYSRGQIREWKSSSYDSAVISPTGRTSADLASAAQEYRRSRDNTGIFILVKDIENPEWHIRIDNKKTLSKWFEILSQEING